MQSGDQCSKFFFLDVLEFVNENGDDRATFLRRNARYLKQCLQVVFEVAVVGKPRLRVKVKPDLDVLIFHLECLCEASQPTQGALSELLCLRDARKAQQGLP